MALWRKDDRACGRSDAESAPRPAPVSAANGAASQNGFARIGRLLTQEVRQKATSEKVCLGDLRSAEVSSS